MHNYNTMAVKTNLNRLIINYKKKSLSLRSSCSSGRKNLVNCCCCCSDSWVKNFHLLFIEPETCVGFCTLSPCLFWNSRCLCSLLAELLSSLIILLCCCWLAFLLHFFLLFFPILLIYCVHHKFTSCFDILHTLLHTVYSN